MVDFEIKQGSNKPYLRITLTQDAIALDLSDATSVVFSMTSFPGNVPKIFEEDCTIIDAAEGIIEYQWTTYDTETVGQYQGEFKIIFLDGSILIVPQTVLISVLEDTAEDITATTAAYCTQTEAETYLASKLDSGDWDEADQTRKNKALLQATKIINSLNYAGELADEDQENEFPRDDDEEVPQSIKDACVEIALALLKGIDPEKEFEALSFTGQVYANVRTTYDRSQLPEHLLAGVPSITAWRFLKPYLRDMRNIKVCRAS